MHRHKDGETLSQSPLEITELWLAEASLVWAQPWLVCVLVPPHRYPGRFGKDWRRSVCSLGNIISQCQCISETSWEKDQSVQHWATFGRSCFGNGPMSGMPRDGLLKNMKIKESRTCDTFLRRDKKQPVPSTFIWRAEWKRGTEPPCGRSWLNHDLKIVRRCLILANLFEVIPGLQTLTPTHTHTHSKTKKGKKMKLHTLRPADGRQRDAEKMTQFFITDIFPFLNDACVSVEWDIRYCCWELMDEHLMHMGELLYFPSDARGATFPPDTKWPARLLKCWRWWRDDCYVGKAVKASIKTYRLGKNMNYPIFIDVKKALCPQTLHCHPRE